MPRSAYLLVTFNFEGEAVPASELKAVFNKALDWVNYAPNCYILYTTTSYPDWYARLKKIVGSNASIFIVEFDPAKRAGFLPKNVWEWFKKDRTN